MTYEVWAANLNSLYNENADAPVCVEKGLDYQTALKMGSEIQTHDMAAWVQSDTGEIFPLMAN